MPREPRRLGDGATGTGDPSLIDSHPILTTDRFGQGETASGLPPPDHILCFSQQAVQRRARGRQHCQDDGRRPSSRPSGPSATRRSYRTDKPPGAGTPVACPRSDPRAYRMGAEPARRTARTRRSIVISRQLNCETPRRSPVSPSPLRRPRRTPTATAPSRQPGTREKALWFVRENEQRYDNGCTIASEGTPRSAGRQRGGPYGKSRHARHPHSACRDGPGYGRQRLQPPPGRPGRRRRSSRPLVRRRGVRP